MKNLIIVMVIVVFAAVGISTTVMYLIITRDNYAPSSVGESTCVDSAEISFQGKSSCQFPEQKIEVWPVSKEGILTGAKILVKCTCPRQGAK